ncbi:MAG: hypothetical protein WBB74_00775 [Gaiellaceae bacterium]
MGAVRQLAPHRAEEAVRRRRRAASGPPSDSHRIRLATPEERDDLADFLRLGGWIVQSVGRRDLRARYPYARGDGSERVNLHFSVAIWGVMNEGDAIRQNAGA